MMIFMGFWSDFSWDFDWDGIAPWDFDGTTEWNLRGIFLPYLVVLFIAMEDDPSLTTID